MNYPIDIHTHGVSLQKGRAIVNCFPDSFVLEEGCWYSVGIHPWYIQGDVPMEWTVFEEQILHPQVLAIGEAGLDKLAQTPMKLQELVFRKQVEWAERVAKPVLIHLVKAVDELVRLKRELRPVQPWIIHGFRGKATLADMLLHHGFYLSFGFRFQEAALLRVPADRLFLETDECDKDIYQLYRQVALVRGCSYEDLFESVARNVKDVFFKQ